MKAISKIKSLNDLMVLRENKKKEYQLMESKDSPESKVQIRVAMATCGLATGARSIYDFFSDQFIKRNIDGVVSQTGCMGYCYAEPTVEVRVPGKEAVVFGFVDERKADQIIEDYIRKNEAVDGIIGVNYKTVDNY